MLSVRLAIVASLTAGWFLVPEANAASPVNVSVAPASGSGLGPQDFTYTFSDADGSTNMREIMLSTSATGGPSGVNNCYIYAWVTYPAATVYLNNDNGNGWIGNQGAQVGSNTVLTNSSCSVNLVQSWYTHSGNTFTLNLKISFQPAYAGTGVSTFPTENVLACAADSSGAPALK